MAMTDFFPSVKTRVHDMEGRKFLVRTFVGQAELKHLERFEKEVAAFVEEVNRGGEGVY
jgi:hypothetical protein